MSKVAPFPTRVARARRRPGGIGNRCAGCPMPAASSRTSVGSAMSSPSDTSRVLPGAALWSTHLRRRSHKLRTPISERRPSIDANGNGTPNAASLSKRLKLAFTPGPYTNGGRTTTTSRPVVSAIFQSPTSASCFEIAYGSSGRGTSPGPNGRELELPLTRIELTNTNRRTPASDAARASFSVVSRFAFR